MLKSWRISVMIPKEQQDKIVKKVIESLTEWDLGVIVMRPKDGSLVFLLNDSQSAVEDARRLNNQNFQGGN